jgi:hypothetical protein
MCHRRTEFNDHARSQNRRESSIAVRIRAAPERDLLDRPVAHRSRSSLS